MIDQDLASALEPVAQYYRGSDVTANTVLAAYLRSKGLPASGDAWQTAKGGLRAGMTFDEAADLAFASSIEMPPAFERNPSVSVVDPTRPPSGFVEVVEQAPREATFTEVRGAPETGASTLEWYAKPMGMGDLHGEGAIKLLGQPNISIPSMLVRETAQNSWDARLRNQPVEFTINLRRLEDNVVRLARSSIFTGGGTGLGLGEALDAPEVWVLEISDRGTRGLDGPIRNDLAVAPGIATNFIDLVFNIGAPRDVHMGAGTYGFGKTVSYLTSSCGTVLMWSRTRHEGGLEHRLIGSAIGPAFDRDGTRYTGRHWWGVTSERDTNRVEPLVGGQAETLANVIFARQFDDDETGTSVLILAPDMGGDPPQKWAQELADAATWHLWPKMVPAADGSLPMRIQVQFGGTPMNADAVEDHPVLKGFVEALRSVRAEQQEDVHPGRFVTSVQEVWGQRPRVLLGHLALVMYPSPLTQEPDSETAPLRSPAHHVALMRHEAELLVKYEERPSLEMEGVQWAGVFKPTAQVDDSFAAAEPPAHDDWAPASVSDREKKSHVRVAATRVRDLVSEFLKPQHGGGAVNDPQQSTAALADALADLIPGLEGSRPGGRPSGAGGTRSKGSRPSVSVVENHLGPIVNGRRQMSVRVEAKNPSEGTVIVIPVLTIATEGGHEAAEDSARVVGWTEDRLRGGSRPGPLQIGSKEFKNGDAFWVLLEFDPDLAVDLDFTIDAAGL